MIQQEHFEKISLQKLKIRMSASPGRRHLRLRLSKRLIGKLCSGLRNNFAGFCGGILGAGGTTLEFYDGVRSHSSFPISLSLSLSLVVSLHLPSLESACAHSCALLSNHQNDQLSLHRMMNNVATSDGGAFQLFSDTGTRRE